MALGDYTVRRDHFEEKPRITGLCFPCCCCQHADKEEKEYPCNVCDHNASAEPEV